MKRKAAEQKNFQARNYVLVLSHWKLVQIVVVDQTDSLETLC